MQRPEWSNPAPAARPTQTQRSVTSPAANDLPRIRSDESWIQISSRPSTASLSSAADEIITTGLQLTQSEEQRRRRRLRRSLTDHDRRPVSHPSGASSSQEEYEESESESDRVMSSSNEGLHPLPGPREDWQPRHPMSSASSENAFASNEEDDDDENATAVGAAPRDTAFTPQPNAFTYIPSSRHPSNASAQQLQFPEATSYFTQQRPNSRPTQHRHSFPASQPPQHSPFNIISPNHRVDHDAALRASLNTLLSCAAAARGLPKKDTVSESAARRQPSNRMDTSTLRMVPESELLGGPGKLSTSANATVGTSSTRSSAAGTDDKGKRKANAPTSAAPRSSSKERRATKKPRRTSATASSPSNAPAFMEDLTPTLLTWALSAGVIVLVSALGFSAGYVVGKEAGRAEAEAAAGFVDAISGGGMGCGGDFVREGGLGMGGGTGLGLRRLRWTGGGSVVQV